MPRSKIDALLVAVEAERHAAVDQALAMHPRADADLVEQFGRALFQHAGADASEHVVLAASLEDDRLDSGDLQKAAERQARPDPSR